MQRLRLHPAITALALAWAVSAQADVNQALNRILEENATSAAYARMCDEEPMSEQLKSNTMMLLAVNGLPPHNVQLGSARFNDIMRREFSAVKSAKQVDCPARVREARERLAFTQGAIQAGRREAPSE